MILVTGPTGNTGKLVVAGLQQRGLPFRAMVRSEARQKELEALGIPTVYGDFLKPESLRAALTGVQKAFLVCTPDERLVPCETNFITAARAAGVELLVKCGAHSAHPESGSPNLRFHAEVEAFLHRSGVPHTIVRPHGFMQTFFWMTAPMVLQHGILSYPAGDGPIPLIDVRDVGEALLKVLTEPGYENRTFSLTGPQALSGVEMAEILSRTFGRSITYVESRLEDLDGLMRQMGVPDAPRHHVLWCFREQRAGHFAYTSQDHRELGLTLRTYAEFAADLLTGMTGSATSDFVS